MKIRKILPVSPYDIPGLETWLEEQANEGLFPVYISGFLTRWATFTREGKPGTRFRVQALGKRGLEPTPEQIELYLQAGWHYAFRIGRAFHLFYTTDPTAPELFNDPQSRAMALETAPKTSQTFNRAFALCWLLIAAVVVWCIIDGSKFDVQPAPFARLPLILLYLTNPALLLVLLIILFFLSVDIRDQRIMKRTLKALKAGLPPPPSPGPSKRFIRQNWIALATCVPLLILSLYGVIRIPETLGNTSRSYLSLQALEQVEITDYVSLFGQEPRWENQGDKFEGNSSLLSPVWYNVQLSGYSTQEGDFSGQSPSGEADMHYSPSLDAAYFHLLLPVLARPVARAQMDFFRLVNLTWSYEEVDYPGLDLVILANEPDGIFQMAAVAKGGRLAVFRYAGVEDLEDHLDLLAQAVLAI